jgi:Ni,Fe-hydrogenase I cytochrome b subunit
MIISALRMFFWVSLATFILFYYDGFITPFKNIWTDSDMNKVNTIAYSFYLSIFTVLTGIIIYYDAKTNSCGPDANYIEKSVKELDNILSGKKELNNTQNNK